MVMDCNCKGGGGRRLGAGRGSGRCSAGRGSGRERSRGMETASSPLRGVVAYGTLEVASKGDGHWLLNAS